MSDRVAILRIERKALVELGEHAEFLREHPGDDSPEMAALDGSLDYDYFAPLVWNERNGKLVDGVKRKHRLLALGFSHADVGVVDYDEATHLARMNAANDHNGLHPTIKPLHLVARLVWNSSREGDIVLECFGGSGTTLAAAEHVNRRSVATELDPKYCAVILERMTSHGLTPKLLGNHAPL